MIQVEFERGYRFRRCLARGLEQFAHLESHILLADHQTGGRLLQPVAHTDLVHLVPQHALDPLEQVFLLLGEFGFDLLVGLVIAEIEFSPRDIPERLALVLGEVLHDPFVDPVGQQQHLDAALAQRFQVGAVAGGLGRIGDEEVDGVPVVAGSLEIVVQ